MKRDFLIFLVLLLCVMGTKAWGYCPQDSLDRGNCDTLYLETWNDDVAGTGDHYVRVPFYLTADAIADFDRISAFVVPVCYTHTNPTMYCSVTTYMNRILWSSSNLPRSIFRHLPDNDNPTVHNFMMDLYDLGEGQEWDNLILDLDGTSHFWLTAIAGTEDTTYLGPEERTLIFTMTMRLQDTMTICIDTCFWPPSSHLAFTVKNQGGFGASKIPRPGDGVSYKLCFPRDTSDVKETEGDVTKPTEFSLSQNYPNPFNPTTNFQFTLPKSSHVKIEIFNIVGQKVAIVVDGDMKAGVYTADWNGRDEKGESVSSGIYFYRMRADDFSDMKKMVLVK